MRKEMLQTVSRFAEVSETVLLYGDSNIYYIHSVNEKLPALKVLYFRKYIIQLLGCCYVHVSGQRQAGLER